MRDGVDGGAIRVVESRDQIEAVHRTTTLPLCVLSPPTDVRNDASFLAANGVRILMLGNPTFAVAVKAIYDGLKHLKDGGSLDDLSELQASPDLLASVNRTEEFRQLQREFLRGGE